MQMQIIDAGNGFTANFGQHTGFGETPMEAVKFLNDGIHQKAQEAILAAGQAQDEVRLFTQQLMAGYEAAPVVETWDTVRPQERLFVQIGDGTGRVDDSKSGVWVAIDLQVKQAEQGAPPVLVLQNRTGQTVGIRQGDPRVIVRRIILPVATKDGDRFYDGAGQVVEPMVPAEIVGFGKLLIASMTTDGKTPGFMLTLKTRRGLVNLYLPTDDSQALINAIDGVVAPQTEGSPSSGGGESTTGTTAEATTEPADNGSAPDGGMDDEVFEAAQAVGGTGVTAQDIRAQSQAIVSGNAPERVTGELAASSGPATGGACCNHQWQGSQQQQQTQVPVSGNEGVVQVPSRQSASSAFSAAKAAMEVRQVVVTDNDGEDAVVDALVAQATPAGGASASPGAWALGLDKPVPQMPAPGTWAAGNIGLYYDTTSKQWYRARIDSIEKNPQGPNNAILEYYAPGGVKIGRTAVAVDSPNLRPITH